VSSNDKRNLNPHQEAQIAMCLYNHRYAFEQRGGSIDFWESLNKSEKLVCREIAARIRRSPKEFPDLQKL
jgi:hypothetical protein